MIFGVKYIIDKRPKLDIYLEPSSAGVLIIIMKLYVSIRSFLSAWLFMI
jgi:hypothetical protein